MLNFDRGVSFESSRRSTSIGASKSKKFLLSPGSRFCPVLPGIPVHLVQLATTVTRAWLQDDGSSTNSLKLQGWSKLFRQGHHLGPIGPQI